jgi:hypothetical protein
MHKEYTLACDQLEHAWKTGIDLKLDDPEAAIKRKKGLDEGPPLPVIQIDENRWLSGQF